jgi:hypothetical protein
MVSISFQFADPSAGNKKDVDPACGTRGDNTTI